MLNKLKKISILLLIITISLFNKCASSSKSGQYDNKFIKKGNTDDYNKIKHKTLKDSAYQIYFKLEKPVKCINISISSSYFADIFSKKKNSCKTYFIVEKKIDISQFTKNNVNSIYTEIGKNFDYSWNRNRDITICSSIQNPLMKLDEKSLYRIQFSAFKREKFDFIIAIKADCKVIFHDKTKND